MSPLVWWKLLLFVGAGFLSLGWLSQKTAPDRTLRRIILISYGIRLSLAAALFAISYWHWPILKFLQIGRGFWSFGMDSTIYHIYGAQILQTFRYGVELPDPGLGIEYFMLTALIYSVTGSHPLYPIFVNGWLAAVNGLLAFRMGRRLFDRKAGIIAALLISFWPSSLIWSAQLLKDSLSWFLTFSLLNILLWLTDRDRSAAGHQKPLERAGVVLLWIGLSLFVILLTRLRFYMGISLSLAALLVFGPTSVLAFLRRRHWRGALFAGILAVVVTSTAFARTLNTFHLLSPSHPEVGHFRIALRYHQKGEVIQAEREYQRAISLDPKYKEALLGLATVQMELGHLTQAQETYQKFLALEKDPSRRLPIENLVQKIKFQKQDKRLKLKQARKKIRRAQVRVAPPLLADAELLPLPAANEPEFVPESSFPGDPLSDPNGVAAAEGIFGYAAEFNRSKTQYLSLPHNPSLSPGNSDFTIACWVYLNSNDSGGGIASKWTPGKVGCLREYCLYYDQASDRFIFLVANSQRSCDVRADSFGSPPVGEWIFLTATVESQADRIGISVNHGSVDWALNEGGISDGMSYFQIGTYDSGADSLNGRVDEVGIWKRVLTTKERGLLYRNGGANTYLKSIGAFQFDPRSTLSKGLAAYYNLDETAGVRADAISASTPPVRPPSPPVPVKNEIPLPQEKEEIDDASDRLLAETTVETSRPEPVVLKEPVEEREQALPLLQNQQVREIDSRQAKADALAQIREKRDQLKEELKSLAYEAYPLRLAESKGAVGSREMEARQARYEQGKAEVTESPKWLTQSLSQIDDQILASAREVSPEALGVFRQGFVSAGGYSLMDAWAQVGGLGKAVLYLPRALSIGLLAPFPWQWLDTKGSTGVMRSWAALDMVGMYLLIPFMGLGILRILRNRRIGGWFLLVFILVTAVSFSLVVANLGTLFRLRLQFLLPLLIVAAGGIPNWKRPKPRSPFLLSKLDQPPKVFSNSLS